MCVHRSVSTVSIGYNILRRCLSFVTKWRGLSSLLVCSCHINSLWHFQCSFVSYRNTLILIFVTCRRHSNQADRLSGGPSIPSFWFDPMNLLYEMMASNIRWHHFLETHRDTHCQITKYSATKIGTKKHEVQYVLPSPGMNVKKPSKETTIRLDWLWWPTSYVAWHLNSLLYPNEKALAGQWGALHSLPIAFTET